MNTTDNNTIAVSRRRIYRRNLLLETLHTTAGQELYDAVFWLETARIVVSDPMQPASARARAQASIAPTEQRIAAAMTLLGAGLAEVIRTAAQAVARLECATSAAEGEGQ